MASVLSGLVIVMLVLILLYLIRHFPLKYFLKELLQTGGMKDELSFRAKSERSKGLQFRLINSSTKSQVNVGIPY
jgi:hypothetical protein